MSCTHVHTLETNIAQMLKWSGCWPRIIAQMQHSSDADTQTSTNEKTKRTYAYDAKSWNSWILSFISVGPQTCDLDKLQFLETTRRKIEHHYGNFSIKESLCWQWKIRKCCSKETNCQKTRKRPRNWARGNLEKVPTEQNSQLEAHTLDKPNLAQNLHDK